MALTDRYVTSTGTDTYANSTNSATPMSLTTAFANAAAGDRINIKVGTYTRSASDTPANAGTVTSPIIYRGYSSSIGDGNLGRTNSSGALITTNMPTIAYNSTFRLVTTNAFVILESLQMTTLFSGVGVTLAAETVAKSCLFVNSSTNAAAVALASGIRAVIFDCDISLTGASGGLAALTASAGYARVI